MCGAVYRDPDMKRWYKLEWGQLITSGQPLDGAVTNIWSIMGLQQAPKMFESFRFNIFVLLWTYTIVFLWTNTVVCLYNNTIVCLLTNAIVCPRARRQCVVRIILAMDTVQCSCAQYIIWNWANILAQWTLFLRVIYHLKLSKHFRQELLFFIEH